jgi:cytochrome b561
MEELNWLSIIIAALIPTLMGFVYYHSKVLGTAWMKSLGKTEADFQGMNMAVIFGVSILMSFLLSIFLLLFANSEGQEGEFDNFLHGAWHGAFIGILVAMPVLVTNGLFEMKNFKNLAINVVFWIITLALMSGTLDAMNHWPNIPAG